MPTVNFQLRDGTVRAIDVPEGESVMRGAVIEGLDGIEGECGGQLTCATCHVYVDDAWLDKLPMPQLAETELLEMVDGLRANSRLSCQIRMGRHSDGIPVTIP